MTSWFWWGMGWEAIFGHESILEISEDVRLCCLRKNRYQIFGIHFVFFGWMSSLFIGRPSCYVMKIKPRSYINIRIIYRWVSMSNSVSGIYNILLSYLSLFVHRSSNPVTLMVWYGLRPLSGWIVDSSDAHFWRKYTSWFWLCDAAK